MQHIALILTCLAIGVVLRITGRLPDTAANVLRGWVINVALPAAALNSVHGLTLHADWWLAAATPWIGVALAMVVIVPLGRGLGWSRQHHSWHSGECLCDGGFQGGQYPHRDHRCRPAVPQ